MSDSQTIPYEILLRMTRVAYAVRDDVFSRPGAREDFEAWKAARYAKKGEEEK